MVSLRIAVSGMVRVRIVLVSSRVTKADFMQSLLVLNLEGRGDCHSPRA